MHGLSVKNRSSLTKDHWKSDTGKDFASYSSELLNNSLAGQLIRVTFFTYLDYLSAVTALNLTDSVDGILTRTLSLDLRRKCLRPFFAVTAGMDQSGGRNGSTFLLEPIRKSRRTNPVHGSCAMDTLLHRSDDYVHILTLHSIRLSVHLPFVET